MSSKVSRDELGDSPVDLVSTLAKIVEIRFDHTAIIDGDGTGVSYRQLWALAGQLATRLPIEDGEIVGIKMERGSGVIVGMLAILRAGGIYCPLSPDDPPRRTASLIERIGMRFVLTEDESGLITILEVGSGRCVRDAASGGDRPIYVMWTSGSTGEPKAVVITHRGVLRLVNDRSFMSIGEDDRVAFASNPMFDATTWEVWATLGNGGTIVVIAAADLTDASRLRERLTSTRVTRAFLTTSLFDMLATSDPTMFGGLRSLAVGGEQLRPRTISAVLTSTDPPGEILNGYGPTECTTFSVTHRITTADLKGPRVPIGRPLDAVIIAIVDTDGNAVGSGEEGELWIAGDGVGAGYLNDQGAPLEGNAEIPSSHLAQDRFVETIHADGVRRRWYRTGDLARSDDNGLIDCLGRIDRQVKIRGYRIEPAELEHHLALCDGVTAAATVIDRSTPSPRILAFVVLGPETPTTPAMIRARIQSELPGYMVPSRIIIVDEFPTTPNGKLDAAALLMFASAEGKRQLGVSTSSFDLTLAVVLDCVVEVLGDPSIGPDDDLWHAGLDSLAVVELIEALSSSLGRQVRAIDLVENPTPAQLAAFDPDSNRDSTPGVVIFTTSSDRDPIFIALGGGTSALGFRHMAAVPSERPRPIVVIEPEGLRSPRRADHQIEALADRVVSEIENRQPHGPVILAGWSAGGVIATHATWILEQRGRDVRLMLLDTLFFTEHRRWSRASRGIAVVNHLWRRVRNAANAPLHSLRGHPLADGLQDSKQTNDLPHERRSDQARMFWIQLGALRAYGTPPPLQAQVANFHVRNSLAASVVATALPGSEAFEVPGDHNSMFEATNVPVLVPLMNNWLARTDSTADRP